MTLPILSRLRQAAGSSFVLAIGLFASQSHAAVYVGNWDPFFGFAFQSSAGVDLTWSGSGRVSISDGCLVPSTVQTIGVGPCASGIFDAYSFSLSWTLPVGGGAGGAGSAPFVGFNTLVSVSIDAFGDVDGIQLATPENLIAGISFSTTSTFDVDLDLTTLGSPNLKITGTSGPQAGNVYFSEIGEFPPKVTWTRIPEPGVLSLLAVAALGLGLRRRVRQR